MDPGRPAAWLEKSRRIGRSGVTKASGLARASATRLARASATQVARARRVVRARRSAATVRVAARTSAALDAAIAAAVLRAGAAIDRMADRVEDAMNAQPEPVPPSALSRIRHRAVRRARTGLVWWNARRDVAAARAAARRVLKLDAQMAAAVVRAAAANDRLTRPPEPVVRPSVRRLVREVRARRARSRRVALVWRTAREDAAAARAAARTSAALDATTAAAVTRAGAATDRMAARLDDVIRRRRAEHEAAALRTARRKEAMRQEVVRLIARDRARRTRRRRVLIAVLIAPMVAAAGLAVTAYFVDAIPTPHQLPLPDSTTVYFADGTTVMATLGTQNRTILRYDEMNDAVKQTIVAAEDRTFWTHDGVDLASVFRAAWNNATGGQTQGGSTITQQYARIAADLNGVTYARKAREAMLAWKLNRTYSKEEILSFYLNTVPFGRGAYGIEAAAQTFFGKTARRDAPADQQVTVAEAMLLASQVKQPEPDPADPEGYPGYDPARGGRAAANAMSRWEYVRQGMVALGYLSATAASGLAFPTVRDLASSVPQNGLDRPTGLIVNHVLSELRDREPFRGMPSDYIRNGGFRIVTTVDKRAQDAAEAAADIRRPTAPGVVQGQPADWQAALVAVEPGTGRVLAYYGGNDGSGADHAGWFVDEDGQARGFGQHPPGSSFKVYDLAEALRQGISLQSVWDSPSTKEFPASGRTRSSKAGPVRNASTAACQPKCTLTQATVASLNVTFFGLTEKLGPGNVIDMASRAGIDSMWTDRTGKGPVRVDLRAHNGKDIVVSSAGRPDAGLFTTEVGIGQYGVTVLDHANGMATFAAGGKRAQAHFVREVTKSGTRVYAEQLTRSDVGLTEQQVNELTATLSQVPSAKLPNGWDAAGKTGTWQAADSTTRNAHTWMVGYTRALAVAVWLGTTDGKPLTTKDGKFDVYGSTHAAPIWRQFMVDATAAMGLDPALRAFASAPTASATAPAVAPTTRPAR
jgi:membrane peptidoglycan carboxypeptidase